MGRAIVDERLHRTLGAHAGGFYPHRGTFQSVSSTRNAVGDTRPGTWTAVAELADLPCRLAPTGGDESTAQPPEPDFTTATHRVAFRDRVAASTAMRLVVDGAAYDVLTVEHDSAGAATSCDLEVVS